MRPVLTITCDPMALITMHTIASQYFPVGPGGEVKETGTDKDTGQSLITIMLGEKEGGTTEEIIREIMDVRPEGSRLTRRQLIRSLTEIGIVKGAELHIDDWIAGKSTLNIVTGIVTGDQGRVIYEPGQEG